MPKPDLSRVPEYYHRYINQVPEKDLLTALKNQAASFTAFLKKIPAGKVNYRYAKGKWSIREVVQHIIDTERVFAYRLLCIARGETAPLPSFDENAYADNADVSRRNWKDLVAEFKVVRESTILLVASLGKKQLDRTGIASGKPVYVLGLGFILPGHVTHHEKVLKERYLSKK